MESDDLRDNKGNLEHIEEQMAALFEKRSQYLQEQHPSASVLTHLRAVDGLETSGKKAAYCGVPGAYAYEATIRFFGEDMERVSVDSFDAALTAVDNGTADYAVLPIENSSAGAVGNVYDVLVEHPVTVVGEIDVPICHCLLACPEAELCDITEVQSHSQALQQSRLYLKEHPEWTQIATSNTALSAKRVAEEGKKNQAAIASEASARLYGLKILAKEINHDKGNATRFVVVTREAIFLKDSSKIRICFECRHEKRALYHLLAYFAYHDLNMTRIESRPIPRRQDGRWEYRFFVDFEGNLKDKNVQDALHGLQVESMALQILGTC